MATNIGMMDGAYFVGRGEILTWINSTLELHLTKVEEVSKSQIIVSVRSDDGDSVLFGFVGFCLGGFGSGAMSVDGCGPSRDCTDAQGQF